MIRDLIKMHGGPAKFCRTLHALGVDVPAPTVQAWSAPGAAHREPAAWVTDALAALLNVQHTVIVAQSQNDKSHELRMPRPRLRR